MATAAAAAEAPADAPKPKGNLKKLLLIAPAAIVVLGGVGGGVLFYLKKKQAAAEHAAEAAEEAEPGPKRDPKVLPVFVPMEPFTVNLADKNADRFAQVTLSLEVTDDKVGAQLKAFMPAVRGGMLMTLTSRTAEELIDPQGKVRLAHDLHVAALRAIGASTRGLVAPPPKAAAAPAPAEAAASDAAHAAKAPAPAPAPAAKAAPRGDGEALPIVAVHFSNFIIQ
ncbi:MAG: flagellar basal body-associated protein FliL [Rubrivivax sp.]